MASGRDTRKLSGDKAVVGLVNVQPRGAEARWLLPFCLNLPTRSGRLELLPKNLAAPRRDRVLAESLPAPPVLVIWGLSRRTMRCDRADRNMVWPVERLMLPDGPGMAPGNQRMILKPAGLRG